MQSISYILCINHLLLFVFSDVYAIFDGLKIFNRQTAHILLDCVTDSYDVNKEMAFDLLIACLPSIRPIQV